LKKKSKKKTSDDKQKILIDLLKKHGAEIYDDLNNGKFPKFSIPSRSVSNIVYDKKLRQYILGKIQLLEIRGIHLSFVHLRN